MPNQLTQVLNKMVKQERWRKKPRLKGMLVKKLKTKSGSLKLVLKKKNEYSIYILKRNVKLFEKASKAEKGDAIKAAGRYWLGKFICEKIDILGKANEKYFESEEKQSKLEFN